MKWYRCVKHWNMRLGSWGEKLDMWLRSRKIYQQIPKRPNSISKTEN
jgi:hypothetical protein